MAFISSGYNPEKPMEGRITDIGPHKYDDYFPPVIKNNFGKWLYHEILEPGVLLHVAEGGAKCYTVRVGGTRTMSITHIRELCDIADKYCGGYLRWTTRNNIEFMVEDEAAMKALRDDLNSRKFDGGSFKFPVGGTGAGISNMVHTQGWVHCHTRPPTPPARSRPSWTPCLKTSRACACPPLCASPWPAASTCAARCTAPTSAWWASTASPHGGP